MYILQLNIFSVSFCRGVLPDTAAFSYINSTFCVEIMNKLLTKYVRFDIINFILL